MSTGQPSDSRRQLLQTLIDRVAERSTGDPMDVVRGRVVESLRERGFVAPSDSWVDAVAREAVHGRAYAIDLETLVGHQLTTEVGEQLSNAPAELTVTPSQPPAEQQQPDPAAPAVSTPPEATRSPARFLLPAVGAAMLALAWRHRTRSRRTSGDADG